MFGKFLKKKNKETKSSPPPAAKAKKTKTQTKTVKKTVTTKPAPLKEKPAAKKTEKSTSINNNTKVLTAEGWRRKNFNH